MPKHLPRSLAVTSLLSRKVAIDLCFEGLGIECGLALVAQWISLEEEKAGRRDAFGKERQPHPRVRAFLNSDSSDWVHVRPHSARVDVVHVNFVAFGPLRNTFIEQPGVGVQQNLGDGVGESELVRLFFARLDGREEVAADVVDLALRECLGVAQLLPHFWDFDVLQVSIMSGL